MTAISSFSLTEVEARRPALRTELRAPHVHMPDPRLREDLNDPEHPMQSYIVDFFVHLSVNHTVLPEPNNQGQVRYSASSPDEKAFVCAARHFGVEFVNRTSRGVELNVLGRRVHVDVLASFPFDSARRRSTVLCQISEAPGDSLPTSGASSETPKGPPCPQTLPADDCASSLPGNSVSNVGEDERASAPPSSSTAARASMAGDAHAPPSVSSYTKQEESVTRKRSHQGTTGSRLVAKQHPSQPQAEPLAQAAGTPKASADPSYPPHIAVQADSKQGVVGRTEGQRSGDSSACRKRIVLFSKGADVVILPRLRRLSTHHGCDEEPGARDFSKESELDKTEKQKSAKPKEAAAKRPPQEGTPDRLEKARKPSGQRQSFTEDSRAARNNEDIRPTTRTERNEVDAAGVPLAGTSARTGQVETTGLADEEEFQCRRRMENALEAYAAEGLRTLCIAKRVLDEAEFAAWYEEFSAVELDRGSDKQSRLLGLAEKLEVSLELQGVTGIEDRLQEGVADTIAKLRQAGIHVWMLSGDKTETALNVGVATSLIHRDAHLSRYLWKKDSQNSERLEAQLRVDLDAVEKRLPCSPLSRLLSLRSLIPRTLLCRYSNSASSTNIEPPGPPVSAGFKSEGQNQPVQSCSGSPSRDVGTGGGPRSDSIPSVGNPVEGRVDNTGRRTVVDGGRPAEAARSVLGTGGVSSAEATGAEKSLQGQPGGSITSEREGRVSGGVRTVKGERTSCAGRSEGDSQKEKVVAEADPVQQRYGAGVLMTPGTVENQKELDSTGTCCPSERDERPRRTGNGETSLGDGYVPFRDQKRARHVVSPPEALIVDGEALTFLLADPQRRSRFIRLCCSCVSVICCRVAPHQKGTVVDLVKKATRRITLAIGDGANDCNMILRAHIGVGIKGNEGNQAFNCSDFGLTQFRLLLPLLLVHGRWCYQRVAILVLYIIYKNLVLTVPLFLYGFYCLFSGQKFYPEFLYQFYNICLTSTPITFYGIFEQDVDRRLSLEYPQLYRAGQRDALLDTKSFFSWIFRGIFHGSINFIVCAFCLGYSVVPLPGGRPFDLWLVGTVIMITNCIVANMDILLYSSYLCTPIYMGMALTLISCIVIFVLNSTEYLGGISTGAIFLICEAFPVVFLCCLIISTFSLGLRWFERSFRVNVRPELSDIIQQKEYVGITPYIPKRKVSAEFLRKKLRRKRSSLPVSDTGEKLEAVPPRKKTGPLPIFHDGGDWAGDGACYTADETREPGVYNNKRSRPATTTTPPSKDGARCQRKGTAGRSPGCRRGQNTGRLNDPLYRLQTSFSFGGFAFSEPDPLLLTVERSLSL
ncbi:phospholipid-translocating p-type flippase subfamily protein [Cystoisospora suis]|uniref:Phospholipid-translocating p-type flippase subfamily protein n=1 Tax=Cystoisospora suis TaxID=483139 RepID=A0A2C6KBH3_9APIC|nr:phospholipid-translocating p-type flippase subfamily protein [Cystoisospora suis]